MRMPQRLARVLPALIVAAAMLPAARAAELGAIVGRLTTASGAPVGYATVTAARADGAAIRATLSGSDGVYSFGDLTPGIWIVTAQLEGRPAISTPTLIVVTGKATRSDLVMNVAPPAAAPSAPAAVGTPRSASAGRSRPTDGGRSPGPHRTICAR